MGFGGRDKPRQPFFPANAERLIRTITWWSLSRFGKRLAKTASG
jgi:hypothetical protein